MTDGDRALLILENLAREVAVVHANDNGDVVAVAIPARLWDAIVTLGADDEDREDGGDHEDGGDSEPSLGSRLIIDQSRGWRDATGSRWEVDLEWEHDGREDDRGI